MELVLRQDGRRGLSIRISFTIIIETEALATTAVTALDTAAADGSLDSTITSEASNRGETVAVSTQVSATSCSDGCDTASQSTNSRIAASDAVYYVCLTLQLIVAVLLLGVYGLGGVWGCGPALKGAPKPVAASNATGSVFSALDVPGQTLPETVFALPEFHADQINEEGSMFGTVFALPEYHAAKIDEEISTSSVHQAAMRCGYVHSILNSASDFCLP